MLHISRFSAGGEFASAWDRCRIGCNCCCCCSSPEVGGAACYFRQQQQRSRWPVLFVRGHGPTPSSTSDDGGG